MKKENRLAARQTAAKTVIRDEQNRRLQFAATNSMQEILKSLHTTFRGLDAEAVAIAAVNTAAIRLHAKKGSHWSSG